jgi:hypothetical protein
VTKHLQQIQSSPSRCSDICAAAASNLGTQIKDAFGLPLEASGAYFFTTEPTPDVLLPQLAGSGAMMLLEPSEGGALREVPVVARGPPNEATWSGVVAWAVTPSNYDSILKAVETDNSTIRQAFLGTPNTTLAYVASILAHFDALRLPGSVSLVGKMSKILPGKSNTLTTSTTSINGLMYIVQTHLQFASVTVGRHKMFWVTDTRGSPPPGVAGATVTVYLTSSSDRWEVRAGVPSDVLHAPTQKAKATSQIQHCPPSPPNFTGRHQRTLLHDQPGRGVRARPGKISAQHAPAR